MRSKGGQKWNTKFAQKLAMLLNLRPVPLRPRRLRLLGRRGDERRQLGELGPDSIIFGLSFGF